MAGQELASLAAKTRKKRTSSHHFIDEDGGAASPAKLRPGEHQHEQQQP
jgi:hypothetical protein